MNDREYLAASAPALGWTWTEFEGDVANAERDGFLIRFWFKADDPGQLNCAEANHWKRESYGPAALRRALRELRTAR